MRYIKSEARNGVRTADEDEIVDQEFVDRYTSRETRGFFEALGGTEYMRRNKSGVIYCKSTSPDGLEVHEVAFTPVVEPLR
jgi:hypothetical protein